MGLHKGRLGQRQKRDEQWNARFKELLEYRSEHGDCDVPQSQGKLGTWVNHQRTAYTAGSLSQDRIDRLSNIGFKWAFFERGLKVPWETRFDELARYKTEHGDCNVPRGHGKLGTWVNNQRKAYTAGSLAQDRVDRLNSIGFKWALGAGRRDGQWNARFKELLDYRSEHGDCNVPRSQAPLRKWVSHQRQQYKKCKLSQDRIDRLISIGFKWTQKEVAPTVPWETRFDELVEYKAKHGDCNVPQRQGKLGTWVRAQRQQYKKGKLSQDRIDRLNSIGFDWTPPMGSRKRKDPNGSESDDKVDEMEH